MRYLVTALIGLVVGALGASVLAAVLRDRDPYPKALMVVMKHDLGAAREAAGKGECARNEAPLRNLAHLSSDLGATFGASDDRVFERYASDLRARIDDATTASTDCPRQTEALTAVSNVCSACHRDYR